MIAINPNPNGPKLFYNSIESSIKDRIEKILKKGSILQDKNKINLSKKLHKYLESLLLDDNLKKTIELSASELSSFITKTKATNPRFFSNNTDDVKILYRIFVEYGYNKIGKWDFINLVNIDTCPYCNRSFIYTIDKNKNVKPEIDHFYPKHKFPLLASSYFNLIPSCSLCNGIGGKYMADTFKNKAVNPYLFDNKKIFDYKFNKTNGKFKVELLNKFTPENKMFNLEKLYEKHDDFVEDLYIRSKLEYSPEQRESMRKISGLTITDNKIDRVIVGNYTNINDLHKRPFSKLTRDIAIKMGLIIE